MKKIDKRFFGVHALKQVDFDLIEGEVLGLVGENGAGKSTLMKILGGVYSADSGEIFIGGNPVTISKPADATSLGISFIHQELSLFPQLDIATNIFIQNLPRKGSTILKNEMEKKTRAILDEVGLSERRPQQRVESLQIGERQLIEIARCLAVNTKILVLDEPTSSLTNKEVAVLFALIRKMKKNGVSVIFISHRLDELFEISDRITVMRDGGKVGTVATESITQKELIHMMIGRELNEMFAVTSSDRSFGKELLRTEGLTHKKRFHNISFAVHSGEVVGLYGLLGSGRSEIVRSIFGLEELKSGKIFVESTECKISSPSQAKMLGIGFVSEDRRGEGLILDHSVQKNLSLASLKTLRRALGFLHLRKEHEMCEKNVSELNIATDRLDKAVKYLSGGNQQKVVIAKWLNINPKVLILDEPTRGVDVGAKKEIYSILADLTRRGIGIIVISSEQNEVMGLCDRVFVLRKGEIVDNLANREITKERLLSASMGGEQK
ncbi:MAG: sugar ABC transporter ATP-binding protein [Oscillospiraceae bacterium]